MNEVFSMEELTLFNDQLLQRGAPVEIDDTGYNKFDYNVGITIKIVENHRQATKVSRLLIKYCKTQLNVDVDKMKRTALYYENKATIPSVFIDSVDDKGIWCKWAYDTRIKEILDTYHKSFYTWNKHPVDGWKCRLSFGLVEEFCSKLADIGYDVEDLKTSINSNKGLIEQHKAEVCERAGILPKGYLKITVGRQDADYLTLAIDWDNPISETMKEALKSTSTSRWNKQAKCYTIDLTEVIKLNNTMKALGIESDALEFWVCQMTHISENSWNGKFDPKRPPFPFQIEDVQTLIKDKATILGNDMGCGKTYEAVMVGESLNFPKLIVCPASLRLNWKKEIKMVNPDADIVILENSSEFKTGKDWTIIGYPSVANFSFLLECQYFQGMFIDEAHFIKAVNNTGEPDSIRAKAVLRLAKTSEYVYPITGTPITNRNKDLWNIMKLIRHPSTIGNYSWNNYGKTFCDGQQTAWGWDYNGSTNNELLHELIAPYMIRHLKSEVLPHLKKIRDFVPVSVDLREYNREIEEYLKHRENKEAEQLARLTRARLALARRKAPEAIKFADELTQQGEQVIIVTNFNDVVDQISKHYKDKCVKIVGGMSDSQKDNSVTRFQNGEVPVCVMNTVSGGVGLTLTAARYTIFVDFDWTPGNMIQAEDRTCRTGQNELCKMYYLYAEGADMDEMFAQTLTDKMESINDAIDGGSGDAIDMKQLVMDMLEMKAQGMGFKPVVTKRTTPIKREVVVDKEVKEETKAKPQNNVVKNSVAKTTKKSSSVNFKDMTMEELKELAQSKGAVWKPNDNQAIERMRITVALKKII